MFRALFACILSVIIHSFLFLIGSDQSFNEKKYNIKLLAVRTQKLSTPKAKKKVRREKKKKTAVKESFSYEDYLISKIQSHIVYPKAAYRRKIEGKVFLSLTLNNLGEIIKISFLKGSHPLFKKEVLRQINKIQDFLPIEKEKTFIIPLSFHF